MKRRQRSLRNSILWPLVWLLGGLVLMFGLLAWSFGHEYARLSRQIASRSEVTRQVIEIARTRARTQEALLLFRQSGDPSYVDELRALETGRSESLQKIEREARLQPALRPLAASLVMGLTETRDLRNAMIQAIQEKTSLAPTKPSASSR